MKKRKIMLACLLAAALTGCGSGNGESLPEQAESNIENETGNEIGNEIENEVESEMEAMAENEAEVTAEADAFVFGDSATMDHNVNGRELPIYCVDTEEKKIALSFDAAWGNEDTAKLLAILKEHDLKVTFFMTGGWVLG